jgi:predicted nuclease of predicted toxin-antitoxin system
VKLLIDMNLSPRWTPLLAAQGFEAVHWSAIGAANAPDTAIMAYARSGDWVVLTADLDFSAILAATHSGKPSVVQLRAADISPEGCGVPVIAALVQAAEELKQGALVTIDLYRTRLRILPL